MSTSRLRYSFFGASLLTVLQIATLVPVWAQNPNPTSDVTTEIISGSIGSPNAPGFTVVLTNRGSVNVNCTFALMSQGRATPFFNTRVAARGQTGRLIPPNIMYATASQVIKLKCVPDEARAEAPKRSIGTPQVRQGAGSAVEGTEPPEGANPH